MKFENKTLVCVGCYWQCLAIYYEEEMSWESIGQFTNKMKENREIPEIQDLAKSEMLLNLKHQR